MNQLSIRNCFGECYCNWKGLCNSDSDQLQEPLMIFTKQRVYCLDCSPIGRYIAYATESFIRIHDLKFNCQFGSDFKMHAIVDQIKYSSNGQFIATASLDGYVRIWKSNSQKVCRSFHYPNIVRSLSFSPCDKYIASGCSDRRMSICNVFDKTQAGKVFTHNALIQSIQYSHNGEQIIVLSEKTIRIWNVKTSKFSIYINNSLCFQLKTFQNSKLIVASTMNKIALWDKDTKKIIRKPSISIDSKIEISSDKQQIICCNPDGIISFIDISSGKMIAETMKIKPINQRILINYPHARYFIHNDKNSIVIRNYDIISKKY